MDKPIVGIISALVSAVITFILVRLLDRLRGQEAETQAKEVLDRAETEASNTVREAELEAKDRVLQQKAAFDQEMARDRDEVRAREKTLDKRQEMVEQQAEDLRKQERIVETTQRRLKERLDASSELEAELKESLNEQRQKLHEVSGLNQDHARERLLEMLDRELQSEQGKRIARGGSGVRSELLRDVAKNLLDMWSRGRGRGGVEAE